MSCKDCFNNCGSNGPLSDQCVKYTGGDNSILDICKGDPLPKVNEAIVEKLISALDGTGITPTEVSLENCEYLEDLLNDKPATLGNLLQLLIDSQCSMKTILDILTAIVPFVFDKKCLDVTNTASKDELLQASINLLCTIKTTVDGLPTTYVKISDLKNQVITIINEIGGEGNQYYKSMIPYAAIEYYGPLSNFDSTGKGLSAMGFDKVYLCNGSNSTPDKRGRVAVGAIRNVPGNSLDSAVNPSNPLNPNTDYVLGDKFGESYHTTTVGEMPSHSHPVVDPGHDHEFKFGEDTTSGNNHHNFMKLDGNDRSKNTESKKTGITISNTGGGLAHNNRQPSIAAYFIMYIPS